MIMKVLIIRSFPSVIDLKKNTYNQQEIGLATAMMSLGHEAGIVYFGGKEHRDEFYLTEVGTIRIYYRKAKVFVNKIAFYETFDDLKKSYDMLVLNEYDQYETFKTLEKYSDKSIIYHGPYYSAFNKRYNLYNKLYDFAFLKKIVKLNPSIFTKSKLAQEYLESKGLSVVDYLGVGLDEKQLQAFDDKYHPLYKVLDESKINLLYIGKLEERRNPCFMLDVLKGLDASDKKYHLIVVGSGDKTYIAEVLNRAKELCLEDKITYVEKLEQKMLPFLYEKCDLFLLPTAYEIWGMVLMEAMKFDCPVITTYNGGSSCLIKSGINGEILELDVASWVETIKSRKYDSKCMHLFNETVLKEKCDWKRIAERMISQFIDKHKG